MSQPTSPDNETCKYCPYCKFSFDGLRELEDIAEALDDHVARGEPYSLTFYNGEIDDPSEFITEAQRERLTKYLSYHFRDIWGQWIQAESDIIRKLIGKPTKHY